MATSKIKVRIIKSIFSKGRGEVLNVNDVLTINDIEAKSWRGFYVEVKEPKQPKKRTKVLKDPKGFEKK